MRTVIPALRLLGLMAWLLVLLPLQAVALLARNRVARKIPVLFHRGIARLLGLQIEIRGSVADQAPILFVSNHSSWLDVVVLSTLAPVSFVAKREIAGWPGVGILAKLQTTVFVDRKRASTNDGLSAMRLRLAQGSNLVLFAEGTSGDGNRILAFKSALFSAAGGGEAEGPTPQVQPVSIAYTHLDGLPLGRRGRPRLTWYGKMPLGRHLWAMLGHGPARIVVEFHPPVRLEDFGTRKALAAHCRQAIVASHGRALSGRPLPPVPAVDREAPPAKPAGKEAGAAPQRS